MEHIERFEGKRNSVITMFIPPAIRFSKNIESIERSVKSIKHSNKRGQILSVIRHIKENTKEREKLDSNGLIICCGYTLLNDIEYHELSPPNKIKNFEYYYDYVFNIRRIREVFNEDVIISLDTAEEAKKLSEVEKHIVNSTNTAVIGSREIQSAIESGVLSEIYYLSDKSVDSLLIEMVRSINGKIIKIDLTIDKNRELSEKYGEMIGLLHYPVDLSEMNDQNDLLE